MIGSFNLDPRSKNLNSESLIVTDSEEAIKSLEEKYQSFLSDEYSIEIDAEKAKTFKKGSSFSDALFKNFAKDLTFLL